MRPHRRRGHPERTEHLRLALFSDTYVPQLNGAARTLRRLVHHLQARGGQVALVTPHVGASEPCAALHLQLPGVPVPRYPELQLAHGLGAAGAARLRAFAPDLVHVATEFGVGWSGVRWARRHGVPLVSSLHTHFPTYAAHYGLGILRQPLWEYMRRFHARAQLTFVPSRATRDEALGHGFHPCLRIWSRGVDLDLFSPARRSPELRQRMVPDAEVVLLYVGRLAAEKRIDLLLQAYHRVHEAAPVRTALLVVGGGPERTRLEALAGPGVRFTGYLDGSALAAAYAGADLFVFPSDTEAFGNVVLEAMASGLPVIAPAAGGLLDIVEDRVTGRLVAPGGVSASESARNSPHARSVADHGTPGFIGYSWLASAKRRCASSPERNSSSRTAFSRFLELRVTPAPLTFTCVPRPAWFGKNAATCPATRRSSGSSDSASRAR